MRGNCFKTFILISTIVICLFIFVTPSDAKDSEQKGFNISIISDIIAKDLYNLDAESIEHKLKLFLENSNICSIDVIDSITQKSIAKKTKKECEAQSSETLFVVYSGDIIGTIKISFKDSLPNSIDKVTLSREEVEFINKHPIVKIGASMEYRPFDFTENGEATGFSIEYLKLLESKIPHLKFTFVTGYHWNMLKKLYQSGDIDMLHTRSSIEDGQSSLFTKPFLKLYSAMAVRNNEDINSIQDLIKKRKTLAVIRGVSHTNKIATLYPELKLYYTTSPLKALKAISDKEADAYIDSSATIEHLINRNLFTNVKIQTSPNLYPFESFEARIEIKKDLEPLYSIMTKAMEKVSIDEMSELRQRWFGKDKNSINEKIKLTNSEQNYLKKKEKIKVVGLNNYEPFFQKKEGLSASGYSVDLINIITNNLDLGVEYIGLDSIEDIKQGIKKGLYDVALNIQNSNKNLGSLSRAYFFTTIIVAKHKNSDAIINMQNLEGKIVGIRENSLLKNILEKRYPNIKVLHFSSDLKALKALQKGEISAVFLDEVSFFYNQKANSLNNLEIEKDIKGLDIRPSLHFLISKQNSTLEPILNRVLDAMHIATIKKMEEKWITPNMQINRKVKLSSLEKDYLREKEYINVCTNKNNIPFSALKDGKPQGMISDIIDHFTSTTDAKFRFVEMSYPYEGKRLVEEKKCDILPFVTKNQKTESFLDFSRPTVDAHSVYITREKHSFIASVDDIKNRKLALVKYTPLSEFFLQNFPELDFMLVDSAEEAFRAVANGDADVCVDFLSSADERIKNLALYELKFSGNTPFNKPLRLGISDDSKHLESIINKSLEMLSDAELKDMMDKWVSVKLEYRFDYRLFWEMALVIGVIIAIGIFYNYKTMRLNREISRKNRELNKQKDIVQEKNKEYMEINKQISDSINYATYIQRSFLPTIEMMKNNFSDIFVLWEPRDKVGGDIYFYDSTRDGFILAVIDCTGHGVPGGFITMIVGTALKRLKDEDSIYHTPSELLRFLNINIKLQLNQNKPETLSDDGVDIGLCYIDRVTRNMIFCGAKISLYYTEDGELKIIKGDKESIGYKKSKIDYEYQEHHLPYKKGRTFYLFSDGVIDQGGGKKGFPFGYRRIKSLLLELEGHDFETRGQRVLAAIKKYQGDAGARDDMTMIGFRID